MPGFEPVFMHCCMFSTNEVSPAYGIFHYFIKKSNKRHAFKISVTGEVTHPNGIFYILRATFNMRIADGFLL
jgi:hypothetical protein